MSISHYTVRITYPHLPSIDKFIEKCAQDYILGEDKLADKHHCHLYFSTTLHENTLRRHLRLFCSGNEKYSLKIRHYDRLDECFRYHCKPAHWCGVQPKSNFLTIEELTKFREEYLAHVPNQRHREETTIHQTLYQLCVPKSNIILDEIKHNNTLEKYVSKTFLLITFQHYNKIDKPFPNRAYLRSIYNSIIYKLPRNIKQKSIEEYIPMITSFLIDYYQN